MERILNFLTKLKENNNREWFEANRKEYLDVKKIFENFVVQLIEGISQFDKTIHNITVKDCTYRIYRDLRFSKDKTPYKTHLGAFVCPFGKKSGYSGYYFHIEPNTQSSFLSGGHQLITGSYRPTPKLLQSIREEIWTNGEQFVKNIKKAEGFKLIKEDALKKAPRGFPSDYKYIEYIKLKDYCLAKTVDDKFILNKNLIENTIKEFRKTYDFNYMLNQAIEFALEE